MVEHKTGGHSGILRWRKPLLITEFSALAILVGSMVILSRVAEGGNAISQGWLLVPAVASLAVFLSFLGLMYLRWVSEAGGQGQLRHKITFGLLTLTLLGIWAFGIARTWLSMS